jgi:hypothetical protein
MDDDGYEYNPPEDVQVRQFCQMAKEFGFASATEFALVVEGWTQEQRRNCLDAFYKRRAAMLAREAAEETGDESTKQEENASGLDDAKTSIKNDEEMDSKPVKYESKEEVKGGLKEEQKPDMKAEKGSHGEQMKDVKLEADIKPKTEVKPLKLEGGTSKRTSIFLSDDDEDDEL